MKHKKNLFLCLIAILAIFSVVSCDGNTKLPSEEDQNQNGTVIESEDLSAWLDVCNENLDLKNSYPGDPEKTVDINIKVTGTVSAVYGSYTYLTDDNGNVLLIYGKLDNNEIKSGAKVTVSVSKLMKFFYNFQTKNKWVTIDNVVPSSAPVEPELITDQATFNQHGHVIDMKYVKVYGRVVSTSNKGTYQVNLYTELPTITEESKLELANPETAKEDTAISITVRPEKNVNMNFGDIGTFIGITTDNKKIAQLKTFEFEPIFTMPEIEPVKATIADWNEAIKTNSFPAPLEITGVVAYTSEKNVVLVEPGKIQSMILYRSAWENAPKIGQEMTVIAKGMSKANENHEYRCESFTYTLGAENKSTIDDMLAAEGIKTYTSVDTINAEKIGWDGNHVIIKVTGTYKKPEGSNYATFVLNDSDAKHFYVKDDNKLFTLEEGKTYEVYGIASTNGKTSATARAFAMKVTEIQ